MLFSKIKQKLSRWSKILEIWFWDGYLLSKLSNFWYSIVAQDLSEDNISITQKQLNNDSIHFILWDDTGVLKVEDNSLNGFVASEVLEHMTDEELNTSIKEIYRCLKKWGYAFLTFPAKENLKENEIICPQCWEIFHKWWHKQYWNEQKILNVFSDFKIILIKEFFGRYPWKNFIERVLGYIMRTLRTLLNKLIHLDGKTYLIILKKV